jgi:hypothetical protein
MKRYFYVLAVLAFVLQPMVVNAKSDSSHINKVRKEIGRELLEMNDSNWVELLKYYTDDIEYHDPIVDIYGMGEMTGFLGGLFGSSPDLVTIVENETSINGIYTATWTMSGYFAGVPYSAQGMSIIKFRPRETQAYYQRDYYTEGDIMINIIGDPPGSSLDGAVMGFRHFYKCAVDPTYVPFPPFECVPPPE